MDWEQLEKQHRLLIDDDFSWSEPPRRRRRGSSVYAPSASGHAAAVHSVSGRGRATAQRERGEGSAEEVAPRSRGDDSSDRAALDGELDALVARWSAERRVADDLTAQDDPWDAIDADPAAVFDLSDAGALPGAGTARRTVVITGRGDDRYLPAPRRRPGSDLRFHERATFSPDRAGLWAVLLGLALVIGAIVH
ncbi:MAG TPA: hypothetical protein VFN65_13970 [Solirubrobacteraceae bacterium]|nr:hypothetical protein [Solirubrobacteraceae bacterium]